MTPSRSSRARWACGLSVAAGFFTLPLMVPLVLVGHWTQDLGPVGNAVMEALGAWLGCAIAAVLAIAGFTLGWVHRRDIEVRGAPPVDAGLARAGEILGALVGLVAFALLTGLLRLRG